MRAMATQRRVVLALGGNALIRPGETGTAEEQMLRLREVAAGLGTLGDCELVVTHGNGPQVGEVLLRSELCVDEVPPMPMDLAVASTQGSIGTMFVQALRLALGRPVVTVLSHTLVDPDDPAFQAPEKYIGRFYAEAEALDRKAQLGWTVAEDPGRGWRRVVPSPRPVAVLEADAVASLLERGVVVVAGGGGGVPVMEHHGALTGLEAVVDKDRVSALLATQLGAELLVVLTGVDQVLVGFGTPAAAPLAEVDPGTLRAHLEAGEFPPGSMGPKIEAVLDFVGPGRDALITSPERLPDALAGVTGTWVRG